MIVRLQAMGELLVPGTGEYEDANIVRMGDYREAARVVKEPSIAGIVGHEVCPTAVSETIFVQSCCKVRDWVTRR